MTSTSASRRKKRRASALGKTAVVSMEPSRPRAPPPAPPPAELASTPSPAHSSDPAISRACVRLRLARRHALVSAASTSSAAGDSELQAVDPRHALVSATRSASARVATSSARRKTTHTRRPPGPARCSQRSSATPTRARPPATAFSPSHGGGSKDPAKFWPTAAWSSLREFMASCSTGTRSGCTNKWRSKGSDE